MPILTLYHGTPNLPDLLQPGGWARRFSGHSSRLDIYGVHLTRSRQLADHFGSGPGGGVVRVEFETLYPLYLAPEDIQRQEVTLIQVGNYWRKSDGSLLDLADGWVENAVSVGTPTNDTLAWTHGEILLGRMNPTNYRKITINLLSPTYCDAVIWPKAGNFEHFGESEVTVFDTSRIKILKVYANPDPMVVSPLPGY
jgi:hypothetical protein